MTKYLRHLACLAVLAAASPLAAQLTPADHKAITTTLDQFTDSWKRHDMTAFAATIAEDCDWVNIVGMHWKGKAQVVHAHDVLLSTRYKGVQIHTTSHDESEIAPGVALVIWVQSVDAFTLPTGQAMPAVTDTGTAVMVRRGDRWLFRSFSNVTVDPIAAQHDPGK